MLTETNYKTFINYILEMALNLASLRDQPIHKLPLGA